MGPARGWSSTDGTGRSPTTAGMGSRTDHATSYCPTSERAPSERAPTEPAHVCAV